MRTPTPPFRRRRGLGSGVTLLKFGDLPGAAGDYFSTPDSAAASIDGDIDIRARGAMDDWTPATDQYFVSKFTAGQHSFLLGIDSGGVVNFLTSVDGSADVLSQSTSVTGFTNGTVHWIRATWNDTTDKSNFYTSEDGKTWTQLGDPDVAHVSAGIFDSTAGVEIGSLNAGTGSVLSGKVYRAQIFNGIDGTLAVDFNPNDDTDGDNDFTSKSTGEAWTANGNATIIT